MYKVFHREHILDHNPKRLIGLGLRLFCLDNVLFAVLLFCHETCFAATLIETSGLILLGQWRCLVIHRCVVCVCELYFPDALIQERFN